MIILMLETIAEGLGGLLNDVVFVGGAVVPLYIEDLPIDPRMTYDVDCIIEIDSEVKHWKLEGQLRDKGFEHSIESNSPKCRWIYKDVIVDIMPTNIDILGFSNQWYDKGCKNTKQFELSNGLTISILLLPFFIATKIEAFNNRGNGDFRLSKDIEDIITIFEGITDFGCFYTAEHDVKNYLITYFSKFYQDNLFKESIDGHITRGPNQDHNINKILNFIKSFCELD